jgi:hypothetical protein
VKKIQLLKINDTTIQICLKKDGEDFYSVLAEVDSDKFCDEHKLNLDDVAVQIGSAIPFTSLTEDDS